MAVYQDMANFQTTLGSVEIKPRDTMQEAGCATCAYNDMLSLHAHTVPERIFFFRDIIIRPIGDFQVLWHDPVVRNPHILYYVNLCDRYTKYSMVVKYSNPIGRVLV